MSNMTEMTYRENDWQTWIRQSVYFLCLEYTHATTNLVNQWRIPTVHLLTALMHWGQLKQSGG